MTNWFTKNKKPVMVGESRFPDPKIDTESETWAAVVQKVKIERQELLEMCATPRKDAKERDVIAGQVKQCDWLLKLHIEKKLFGTNV